jgi:hypothetical protein
LHRALAQASEEQRLAFETLCKFDKVYVDEVQDLTSAELALLVKMSSSGILFLAGGASHFTYFTQFTHFTQFT